MPELKEETTTTTHTHQTKWWSSLLTPQLVIGLGVVLVTLKSPAQMQDFSYLYSEQNFKDMTKVREIPLSQGKVAIVDAADYAYLNQWKWSAYKDYKTFYAVRTERTDNGTKKGLQATIKMHRVILGLTDSNMEVDHKDHNGLNNCRSNLRVATSSQNKANRKARNGTLSKYKGIYFRKDINKWAACAFKDYKKINLGYFKTDVEAALAYNKKSIELHGEFACLNIIE